MTEQQIEIIEYNKNDYVDLLQHSFSDLIRLSKGDKQLFDELFYNREHEFIDFRNAAEKLYLNGNNILVIGSAGIGKSNYVYRLFYDSELLNQYKLYPIMFDYRTISPNNLDGWKMHFINELEKYFNDLDYQPNLKDNTVANLNDNLFLIQKQFGTIPLKIQKYHPILFIDDLDYAEEEQLFELLDFLSPYARNEKISILLSVRPQLLHAIQHNDFKYHFLFTNNVKKITLAPLHLHNVLSTRLAPIVVLPQKHSILSKLQGLKSEKSKYHYILKNLGIKNLQNLKEFEYPFTDGFVNFMSKITDDNLREVFDIAIDSLYFILENYNKLESQIDLKTGGIGKVLTQKHIIDLFLHNDNSLYKLYNLHTEKNKSGNSLDFNVLEAVQSFGCSSEQGFFESLSKMGHSRPNVINSLKKLARRKNRFLMSFNFTYAMDKVNENPEFKITEKGRYYLSEISTWEEYIKICGKSQKSIINNILNEV